VPHPLRWRRGGLSDAACAADSKDFVVTVRNAREEFDAFILMRRGWDRSRGQARDRSRRRQGRGNGRVLGLTEGVHDGRRRRDAHLDL